MKAWWLALAAAALRQLRLLRPARRRTRWRASTRAGPSRVQVGSEAGGNYDLIARTVARHMGKHIPGQPQPGDPERAGRRRVEAPQPALRARPARRHRDRRRHQRHADRRAAHARRREIRSAEVRMARQRRHRDLHRGHHRQGARADARRPVQARADHRRERVGQRVGRLPARGERDPGDEIQDRERLPRRQRRAQDRDAGGRGRGLLGLHADRRSRASTSANGRKARSAFSCNGA